MSALHVGWKRSLVVRLVGMSLLLLLLVQVAGFGVVRAAIERNARSQIARALDTDENVWRHLLAQNADRLRQGATLLAADYGFRSAVHSDDLDTIESALQNHGLRLGVRGRVDGEPWVQVEGVDAGATVLRGSAGVLREGTATRVPTPPAPASSAPAEAARSW